MSVAVTESPAVKRPPPLVIPDETIPAYTLRSPLGEGIDGRVYKAFSERGSPLAAKTNLYKGSYHARVLQKEGKILELLKNAPHTLKMRQRFPVTNTSYLIVTERLVIPNTRDAFIKGNEGATPLLCKQLFSIAKKLGEALHYYHQTAGIVHRDLKPEHLFYNTKKDELKIIDFGMAEKISALPKVFHARLVVTRWYRSPEATLVEPYTDTIDLWSVGCILFELYTGFILFPSEGEDINLKTGKICSQTTINQFHYFTARLGLPSEEWIVSSQRRLQFYEQNPNTKQYFLRYRSIGNLHLRPWKGEIFAAAQQKKESKEEAQKLCDLIEPMLDYDFRKRINAEGLLKQIDFLSEAKATNNQAASTESKVETVT